MQTEQLGSGAVEVSHRALFEDYLSGHVTVCAEPGPCRDEALLRRAAEVLLLQPEPSAALSLLYPLLVERVVSSDLRHLFLLVRASELLETLSLHLHLQPWRREIRSLKTFTGAFVYVLLPALSRNTLHWILGTIGYLPLEPGPKPSEYRLSEEASPERALRVAFELVLIRALCLHLPQHDQLTVQEWVLRLKDKLPQLCENTSDATERENHKTEEEKQDPDSSEEEPGLTEDQSISPLHVTYPDLVFRGRPLLRDPDSAPSQDKVPPPHRRHAQRLRVPPAPRPTDKDRPGDEGLSGLSGPLGLSLHITLRPQTSGFPTCGQHQTADVGGLCEDSDAVRSETEEEQKHQPKEPEEHLDTDTEEKHLDQETSTDSDDDVMGILYESLSELSC